MTVLPVRSTRPAPTGAITSPFLPTGVIVPLSTRNAESTRGALPSPAMSLAPSYRTTGAGPLDAISTDGFEHATSATNPKNAIAWRNMAGPYGLNTYSGVVVFAPL